MNKLITVTTVAFSALLAALFAAPSAYAMVPPEPNGPSSYVPIAEQTGAKFMSWSTVALAVAVGAVLALVVERLVRRQHSSRLASAYCRDKQHQHRLRQVRPQLPGPDRLRRPLPAPFFLG